MMNIYIALLLLKGKMMINHEDELLPPWIFISDSGRYSIVWRQGKGQEYIAPWWEFFNSMDDLLKKSYLAKYPEPKGWEGFYTHSHPLLPEELQNEIRQYY